MRYVDFCLVDLYFTAYFENGKFLRAETNSTLVENSELSLDDLIDLGLDVAEILEDGKERNRIVVGQEYRVSFLKTRKNRILKVIRLEKDDTIVLKKLNWNLSELNDLL